MRNGKAEFAAFAAGIIIAIFVVFGALSSVPGSMMKQANDAIDACEATLPRDQHCVVTAVVAPPK